MRLCSGSVSAFWVINLGRVLCILIPLGSAVRASCLLGAFWGPAVGCVSSRCRGASSCCRAGVVLGVFFGLTPLILPRF